MRLMFKGIVRMENMNVTASFEGDRWMATDRATVVDHFRKKRRYPVVRAFQRLTRRARTGTRQIVRE